MAGDAARTNPSSGTSKSFAEPIKRAKGATRTYGRPKPVDVEPETLSSSTDAPAGAAPSDITQTSSDGLAIHAQMAADTSKRLPARVASFSDNTSTDPLQCSSPSHDESTDPTSEEGHLPTLKTVEKRMTNLMTSSDTEMGSEDEDEDDEAPISGALEVTKQKSILQALAEIDEHYDEVEKARAVAEKSGAIVARINRETLAAAHETGFTDLALASDQTITPRLSRRDFIVDTSESDAAAKTLRKPPVLGATSSEVLGATSSEGPIFDKQILELSSTSVPAVVEDQDTDDEEDHPATTNQTKATRPRILDSEDENEHPHGTDAPPSTDFPENAAHPKPSSIRDSSESDALSRRQRLQDLAHKRKQALFDTQKQKSKVSDHEDDPDESEPEATKNDQNTSKPKSLSRKTEEQIQIQLAAAERNRQDRLRGRIKHVLKPAEVAKIHMNRPLNIGSTVPREPSSDPIEPASDTPPAKSRSTQRIATGVPTKRAIRIPREIAGARSLGKGKAVAEANDNDDDDHLGTADEEIAKQQKRLRGKKFAEYKAAQAAKERKGQVAALSSDSEIEIVGGHEADQTSGRAVSVGLIVATPRPMTEKQRRVRELTMAPGSHDPTSEDDITDSQFERAAKVFGKDLGARNRVDANRKPTSRIVGAHHSKQPATIDQDALNYNLLTRARNQNIEMNQQKRAAYRKHQLEEREQAREGELQKVDVNGLLTKKEEDVKQKVEDEDEDEDDGDYMGSDEGEAIVDFEREELGSGAEDDAGSHDEQHNMFETEAAEDEAETVNEPVAAPALPINDEEDGEDVFAAPPLARTSRLKVRARIASDDEADEAEARDEPTVLPSFMQNKGDGGGGLSQFFDSQFDADFGINDDTEGFGFARRKTPPGDGPAPTLMGHLYISDKDRAEDAALLEARGGALYDVEATPKEAAAPRQYVNKLGMLTQTRPAHMYTGSPGDDSPGGFTQLLGLKRTLSDPTDDSQPIAITQTQLVDDEDTQPRTPTQLDKRAKKLRRAGALHGYGPSQSVGGDIAEEDEAEDEDGEDQQEPSAAQPTSEPASQHANAFDKIMATAQNRNETESDAQSKEERRKRGNNAFIEGEAVLSDEEEGGMFGGVSGDEDEGGLDAELESLVDNEKIDEEEEIEQDLLARERHAEDLAKDDQAALDRAQRVVDGKERKRRSDGLDLDDDDFDDDYGRTTKFQQKRLRLDNATVEELKANEKTKAFADSMTESTVADEKAGEYDYLKGPVSDDDVGSDYDEQGYNDMSVDADLADGRELKQRTVSHQEMLRQAAEVSRNGQTHLVNFSDEREASVDLDNLVAVQDPVQFVGGLASHFVSSSSPVNHKVSDNLEKKKASILQKNQSKLFKTSQDAEEFADLDSQGILRPAFASRVKYQTAGGDSGSRSTGDGTTAGAHTAVTSFKKPLSRSGSNVSNGGVGRALSKRDSVAAGGGQPLRARSSLSTYRKQGFA
ncbi:hypothetical protein OIV83_005560 [Microbotryomycetes sp. JL201]|nr:hypothetical protein OIV83_005560 [Microbotryomycetes sp. JL201]